jgi:hypothetical protein
MVIPKEREDLVYRRFREPAMQSLMKDMNWRIIIYETLENFFLQNKNKKKINISNFLFLAREPLSKKQREEVLQQRLI